MHSNSKHAVGAALGHATLNTAQTKSSNTLTPTAGFSVRDGLGAELPAGQGGVSCSRCRYASPLFPPPIIPPSHPSIAAHTCAFICCTYTSSTTTKMTMWPPHRSLKTGGIWQRPGRDCSWSCPSNHIKWKRDQFVEECVQCPPETFDQDALAVAEGPPERESVDRERAR